MSENCMTRKQKMEANTIGDTQGAVEPETQPSTLAYMLP